MYGNDLLFDTIWFRNFLSFGNSLTQVSLIGSYMTVVLGENIDTGGEDSRNGAGKSTIIDALSYALFGKTIRDISVGKLIHKFARKGQPMTVMLQFHRGDFTYLIERGDRPSRLMLFKKPRESTEDIRSMEGKKFKYDISRSKPETNAEIVEIIGFDFVLFEYLVANSSETIPFVKMKEEDRREVTESLFGFKILATKAELLKEARTDVNRDLNSKSSALEATRSANRRILDQIADLEFKENGWAIKHRDDLADIRNVIDFSEAEMQRLPSTKDILDMQEELNRIPSDRKYFEDDIAEINAKIDQFRKDQFATAQNRQAIIDKNTKARTDYERSMRAAIEAARVTKQKFERLQEQLEERTNLLESMRACECPTCHQKWIAEPEKIAALESELELQLESASVLLNQVTDTETSASNLSTQVPQDEPVPEAINYAKSIKELETARSVSQNGLAKIDARAEEIRKTMIKVDDKIRHERVIAEQRAKEAVLIAETNPYPDQIEALRTKALLDITPMEKEVGFLKKQADHYDYLIDLLTNKNSFVRKLILDRWLPYLNRKLAEYLVALELPHTVRFDHTMSLQFMLRGQEYDYGNLSKGERTRVTLAINLAFQNVFEFMNFRINTLMIDELIDNGICNRGAENSINLLNSIIRKNNKRVFLITHRSDVTDQVDSIMTVRKENDVSTIIS